MFTLADENSKTIQVENVVHSEAQEAVRVAQNGRLPDIELSLSASYLGNGCLMDRDFTNGQNIKMPHFGNNLAIKATQFGEECWSSLKVRNRLVEIICQQEGLSDKQMVMDWVNRIHSLPMLHRREKSQEGEFFHLRRKNLRHRDKNVLLPLRSVMDLWNKGLAINNVQKLMIYLSQHPDADILQVLREHQFRYIPSEIRIRYKLDKKVKLYD